MKLYLYHITSDCKVKFCTVRVQVTTRQPQAETNKGAGAECDVADSDQNQNDLPPTKKLKIDDFSDLCDQNSEDGTRNELSEYVNLKVPKDTNMMQFWRDNNKLFPNLFTVACSVLCIPASSAASERVFSTAGRLLEKRRTSLSPNTVNNLLFLHSNIR
jgi:hAT family C-terminal dimerisation region